MNEQTPSSFLRTVRWGLIAGVIAVSTCMIGLIESFDARDVISEQVTLGQILLFSAAPVVGFFMARSEKNILLKLLYGLISGALAVVPIAILIWLTQVFDGGVNGDGFELRDAFLNVSPSLIEIITLGQENVWNGVGRLALIFTVLGLFGALFAFVPKRLRSALLTGFGWAATIGVLSDVFIGILRPRLEKETISAIFGKTGIYLWPFTAIAVFTTLLNLVLNFSGKKLKSALWSGLIWTILIELLLSLLAVMWLIFFRDGVQDIPDEIIQDRSLWLNMLISAVRPTLIFILFTLLSWFGLNKWRLTSHGENGEQKNGGQPQNRPLLSNILFSQRSTNYKALLLLTLLMFVLPSLLGVYLSEIFNIVGLYILMGLGLNIAVGLAGLLDLGYVTNFAVGAYLMALLTSGSDYGLENSISFWVALPICVAAAMSAGFIFALPVLKMRGDYLAIATMGFGEIIRVLAKSDAFKWLIGGAQGILKIPKPQIPSDLATYDAAGFLGFLLRQPGRFLNFLSNIINRLMSLGNPINGNDFTGFDALSDSIIQFGYKTELGFSLRFLGHASNALARFMSAILTPINNFLETHYDLAILRAEDGAIIFGKPPQLYYLIILACLLMLFVSYRLNNSRIGRQWMAIREDEDVAAAMGINTTNAKVIAFTLSAASGGLAGAIFAAKLGSIYPSSFQLLISINVLCLIIVGGLGSIPGVVVGAFALIGVPELLREFAEFRIFFYGIALIAMMLLRPEGLWPSDVRRRELRDAEDEAIPIPED